LTRARALLLSVRILTGMVRTLCCDQLSMLLAPASSHILRTRNLSSRPMKTRLTPQ
jgi:hypothetical protein